MDGRSDNKESSKEGCKISSEEISRDLNRRFL
jgi:hypothetical protein